jgi:hypothetical protein
MASIWTTEPHESELDQTNRQSIRSLNPKQHVKSQECSSTSRADSPRYDKTVPRQTKTIESEYPTQALNPATPTSPDPFPAQSDETKQATPRVSEEEGWRS